MFGLVEASAWMHVRNGTFKMSELIGSESDSVPALFAYFLYWFRESKVADRAKTLLINIKQIGRAKTSILTKE